MQIVYQLNEFDEISKFRDNKYLDMNSFFFVVILRVLILFWGRFK